MGKNRMKICCLLRRQGFSIFQHIRSGVLLLGEVAMQAHIRYKLGEKRFTLGLVLFPRFRALVVQHKVFPVFVLGVIFVIGLDMVDQSAVPVAKVLPSLVAVTFPVECAVNAEFGFIVPAACIARLLTLGTLLIVQRLKKCVGAGKRELFTLLQLIALAPKNRHDGLYRRIKGGCFLAGHFLLVVERGNLLVAGISQVAKLQIVQLALDQRSQRFILSAFNQHITQIFFNAEVRQVCVCLNGDFIIRNGRVSNTNGGQVAEICAGMKFFAAVIVDQLFRKLQFGASPCGVAEMQRVKVGSRGKADVVENIVHITFFQRSGCIIILPRGCRAYAAGCNVVIQACFQMRTDFSVHRQRRIVPAYVTAALLICAVVELHIQQRVGLQALFCGNGIVLKLAFFEGGIGSFLCNADDFRVIPYQCAIDKLLPYLFGSGFPRYVVSQKQRAAVIKANGNITCAAPFSRAGRGFNRAGRAAERLRDHADFLLHRKRFIPLGNFNSLLL